MAELIAALDVESGEKALRLASALKGTVGWLKIGLELFTARGPSAVRDLKRMGFNIFLDLKFYDIPNTVAAGARSAAALEADMLTVHCQGGGRMCQAALESAAKYSSGKLLIFGVTVLTSFADEDLPGLDAPAGAYAMKLADLAAQWGLPGVVCSGLEVEKIKSRNPALLCLCPGIRPQGFGGEDQRRVVSPGRAVQAGADYLVVGRPITQAPDPAKAAEAILEEMRNASGQDETKRVKKDSEIWPLQAQTTVKEA